MTGRGVWRRSRAAAGSSRTLLEGTPRNAVRSKPHGSSATRCIGPAPGLDLRERGRSHLRQRWRGLDTRRDFLCAAWRHAAHGLAIADRTAPDHRGARFGAEPRLAPDARAVEPQALRA